MESSMKSISKPVINRLPVSELDEFACRQLDRVRSIILNTRFSLVLTFLDSWSRMADLVGPEDAVEVMKEFDLVQRPSACRYLGRDLRVQGRVLHRL